VGDAHDIVQDFGELVVVLRLQCFRERFDQKEMAVNARSLVFLDRFLDRLLDVGNRAHRGRLASGRQRTTGATWVSTALLGSDNAGSRPVLVQGVGDLVAQSLAGSWTRYSVSRTRRAWKDKKKEVQKNAKA
jgi:hypothetical protein